MLANLAHEKSCVVFQLIDLQKSQNNHLQQLLQRKFRKCIPKEFIRVFARIRPQSNKEIHLSDDIIVKDHDDHQKIQVNHSGLQIFKLDRVFNHFHTNSDIWNEFGEEMVSQCLLNGFNYTLCLYGVTGSGKSFTLSGNYDNDLPGLLQLVVESLFRQMNEKTNYNIELSVVEIYLEKLNDLLQPDNSIRVSYTQPFGNVSRHKIESKESFNLLLKSARRNHLVPETQMGQCSYRKHFVFSINITHYLPNRPELLSTINFIELAGSERSKFEIRPSNVNTSISTLERILISLDCRNPKAKFTPYRDSKITTLMRESLEGNCRTIMLFNLSPCKSSADETIGALKLANRSKYIMTSPKEM